MPVFRLNKLKVTHDGGFVFYIDASNQNDKDVYFPDSLMVFFENKQAAEDFIPFEKQLFATNVFDWRAEKNI